MPGLAARMPFAVGDVLDGRYRLDAVLGMGGMGVVYRALHLELRQTVAIKVPLDSASDPEGIERLLREGRAAVRLRSDHVCRVLDVGRTPDGLPYIVLEYLEGVVLSERLRRKKVLDIEEVWRVMLEACDAVGEAHRLGIIHRDLKPANLFLVETRSGKGRLKVLDFGISKIENPESTDFELTKTSTLLGSPSYIAPEQMSDTRSVDARADVWALGICAYEMVTGRVPFKGSSLMDLAVRIAGDIVVPPSLLRPDIPLELEVIILRCLSKDRKERFSSADELAAALVACAPDSIAKEFSDAGITMKAASLGSLPIELRIDNKDAETVSVAPESTPFAKELAEIHFLATIVNSPAATSPRSGEEPSRVSDIRVRRSVLRRAAPWGAAFCALVCILVAARFARTESIVKSASVSDRTEVSAASNVSSDVAISGPTIDSAPSAAASASAVTTATLVPAISERPKVRIAPKPARPPLASSQPLPSSDTDEIPRSR